jgi:hypothetical protein
MAKGYLGRDVQHMKPDGFQEYVTITELSRIVSKDISHLRRLERADRIPRAHRVQVGQLQVRLWSPEQVEEIKEVLSRMRVGRPRSA